MKTFLVVFLFQLCRSNVGYSQCITSYSSCQPSCYNTGGSCYYTWSGWYYGYTIRCYCQGSTLQYQTTGCQCTGTLACNSMGCFQGCTGIASDGTKYYGSPPVKPNECFQCTAPRICTNWAVTSCQTGYSLYNSEFCCGLNCSQCNATACTWCQNYYSQYITGLSCAECVSPQICGQTYNRVTGCRGAYYLSESTCVACNANCTSCTATTCSACSSSTLYYLSGANCVSCSSPYTCTAFKISGCVTGYYMPSLGICTLCTQSLANCGACSNTSACTSCSPNTDFYIYQQKCYACDSNRVCTNSAISGCNQPTAQYVDTSASPAVCQTCSTPRICTNSQVTGCSGAFYRSGNNCLTCSSNCNQCTSVSQCTQCQLGTYIYSNYCYTCPSQCPTCTYGNCSTCRAPCKTCDWYQCLTCLTSNQYVAQNGAQCLDCPSQCATCTLSVCTTCTSPCQQCTRNSCSQCIGSNYYISGGINCIPCGVNCATCNSVQCLTCNSGFYVSGITCTACPSHCPTCTATSCLTCLSNCQTCNFHGCLKCKVSIGYFIDGGNCSTCSSGCDYCISVSVCTGCAQSNQYKLGQTCTDCPTHCLTCDQTKCYSCVGNCATCDHSQCLTCVSVSYYISGIDCIACQSGCKTCNSSQCLTCPSLNQYASGTTCTQCPSHCTQCTSTSCTCISTCATCDISTCLTCVATNHFVSGTQCTACPTQCLTCNSTTCITCVSTCLTCNLNQCLTCIAANYYIPDKICVECDSTCSTCTVDGCQTCVNSHYYPIGPECKPCDTTCKTCDKFKCLTCNLINQYTQGNQCVDCPVQCSQCDGYVCPSCVSPCTRCDMSSCFECIASNYYIVGVQCLQCHSSCATCDQTQCLTCVKTNYYVNTNICSQCPDHCITCNSNTCLTCKGLCAVCDYTSCITCQAQNQYLNGLDCIECPTEGCWTCDTAGICQTCKPPLTLIKNKCVFNCDPLCSTCTQQKCLTCPQEDQYPSGSVCLDCKITCKTCSNAQSCLTCPEGRILQSGQCVCPEGYSDLNNQCLPIDCTLLSSRTLKFCKYVDCQDGIWEYGESCDNGNQVGCQNCAIQQGYICYNKILEPSICTRLPENWNNGTMTTPVKIDCNSCDTGYYLSSNTCKPCQDQCLTCDTGPQSCLKCRFLSASTESECRLCDNSQGYYSNYKTNTCYTICGDNIIAGEEQCDIGLQGLGCTACVINKGYVCSTTCELIIYPIPIIVADTNYVGLYDSQRIFTISYNTPVTAQNLSLQLTLNDSKIQYNQSITRKDQNFVLNLTLQNQSVSQVLLIKFLNPSEILSNLGYSQQIDQIRVPLPDYIILSQDSVNKVQDSVNGLTYILIFLIAFVGLSIILGGLQTFWNLLDLLQVVSYLQYINVKVYPYNLSQFLNLFSFIQLPNSPIMKHFNIQQITSHYINFDEYDQPPEPMKNDGFTTIMILNIIPLIQVWIIGIVFVLVAQIVLYFVKNIKITVSSSQLDRGVKVIQQKVNAFIVKLFIEQLCIDITKQWLWSGVMRTFQSSAYDIAFAIVIGFYGFNIISDKQMIRVNSYLTIVLLIAYLGATILMFTAASYNQVTLLKSKQTLGSVYEGLHLKTYTIYYNCTLLVKKLFFMISLLLCFYEPLLQVINIVALSIIQITILIALKPLENRYEQYKQLSCEVLLLVSEAFLGVLIVDDQLAFFDYQMRYFVGWCCIFALLTLIIAQVVFDIVQQLKLLKYYFDKIKILYYKLIGRSQTKKKKHKANEELSNI